jgi:outer membrane protein OmpA-like peptidoglycan-associated protein
MKSLGRVFLLISIFTVAFCTSASAQEDAKGCQDHPFFSRMTNYYLAECKTVEFDSYEFYDPDTQGPKKVTGEGKKYWLHYYIKDEFYDNHPTQLQIMRNHETAVKKVGRKIYLFDEGGQLDVKYVKDGMEIWARIFVNEGGRGYFITLIEKAGMKQEVISDAKTMAADINNSGKIALYGIYFDFDRAEVKPESEPTLKEIAKLLQQEARLKLYVGRAYG